MQYGAGEQSAAQNVALVPPFISSKLPTSRPPQNGTAVADLFYAGQITKGGSSRPTVRDGSGTANVEQKIKGLMAASSAAH